MADVWTKERRSQVMSLVRGYGNKETELVLVKFFRRNKIKGWRRHASLFGKPDFVFQNVQLAVFVDGCFWHGCPKHKRTPKSNSEFWIHKFSINKKRDIIVNRTLRSQGWRILRIWEHELTRRNEARLLQRIRRALFQPSLTRVACAGNFKL